MLSPWPPFSSSSSSSARLYVGSVFDIDSSAAQIRVPCCEVLNGLRDAELIT
jgi:hypothetical protein